MAKGDNKISKMAVWVLMALLIVGLAGFGATNLTGTVRTVGKVGSEQISVDEFAREMQQEMRAAGAQIGQPMTMELARSIGLDQQVLSRLVMIGALDGEAKEMGLSIGDETLRQEITGISAFQGPGGSFDRETYRLALDGIGMSENEFEADLRDEAGRTLLQGAVVAGVSMPAEMTDAIVNFVGARRDFTWAPLTEADLDEPLADPTPEALQAFYDDNPEMFRLPESKAITYVLLSPEMILDTVEIDEAALRTLYDERADQYDVPERRLVERLVFPTEEAAGEAMAQLEVGGTTFEQLVSDRGLALLDVDLGDLTRDELDAAGDAVFEAEFGQVVGPLPSALGPALFRVNGVVAARHTTFEEAEPELRDELAGDRARRVIEQQSEDINDLLAGGATLEELAETTDMELGQIEWAEGVETGVAAYEGFREAAAALTADDFPEAVFLDDGSIVAMRLDETLPERPEPFDAAIDTVTEAWTAAELESRLTGQADGLLAALADGGDFADQGLAPRSESGLTRSDFVAGAPFTLMTEVFQMDEGEVRVVSGPAGVVLVRLDAALPPAEDGQVAQLRSQLSGQLDQQLSNALFQAFSYDAQVRANPQVDQNAVNAVLNSFQ
ncbi:peptidyl-prolyl cis-trans isomerase [Marinibacterium sp. SX1]|uniref:peptidyl-prolyl cis-trans isomerase n=1 Tax=Marinibacterium sp. SX1 TaxID=3388424 RepID=UPI003D17770F